MFRRQQESCRRWQEALVWLGEMPNSSANRRAAESDIGALLSCCACRCFCCSDLSSRTRRRGREATARRQAPRAIVRVPEGAGGSLL